MPVAQFLADLFESGKVIITLPLDEPMTEDSILILSDAEKSLRSNLAGTPPEFSPEVGVWAAQRFYRASRFLVCRDIGTDIIAAEFSISCPLDRFLIHFF